MSKRSIVHINSEGGTCLVVGEGGGCVEFVAMSSTMLRVEILPVADFDRFWRPHDFPLERAVKRYVEAVRSTKSPAFLVDVLGSILTPAVAVPAVEQSPDVAVVPEVDAAVVVSRDPGDPAEMPSQETASLAPDQREEGARTRPVGVTSFENLLDSAEQLAQQTQSVQERRSTPSFKESLRPAPKAVTTNSIQEATRVRPFSESGRSEAPQSNTKEIKPMEVNNENVAGKPLEEAAYQVHVDGTSVIVEMGKKAAPVRTPANFENKPLSVAVTPNAQPTYFVAVDESGLPVRFVTKTVEDRAVNATLVGNWVAEGFSVSTVSLREFRRLLGKLDAAMKAAEAPSATMTPEQGAQTQGGSTSESANDAGGAQSPENSAAA